MSAPAPAPSDSADPDSGIQPATRTSFLETSRRYLFETALPVPRKDAWTPWTLAREGPRPWLSSRAARRSPAWPAASGPWGRR